jgi:hypothetical protein
MAKSKEVKPKEIDLEQQMRINFFDKGRDDTMSFEEYKNKGIARKDLGKKKGGTKHIMELPTNVPRLQSGAILGDLDKDGKMSGYEKVRQAAIEKNMSRKTRASRRA